MHTHEHEHGSAGQRRVFAQDEGVDGVSALVSLSYAHVWCARGYVYTV
jgi:hypothetical protein